MEFEAGSLTAGHIGIVLRIKTGPLPVTKCNDSVIKLNAERRTAAAGFSGIRIGKDKTFSVESAFVIELHADQI